MRLDHPDYIKLVLGTYNRMRANNELSLSLVQSTPGSIRQECVNVYQERYEKKEEPRFRKDEPAIRAFFGQAEHGRRLLAVIQDFDVNKFKPLDNYLKSAGTRGINKRNLELFAWLIDFKHRPYSFGMEVILEEEELAIINNPGGNIPPQISKIPGEETIDDATGTIDEGADFPPVTDDPIVIIKDTTEVYTPPVPMGDTLKKNPKRLITIVLILLIILGGGYVWKEGDELFGSSNTGCMYWADDHYEKVPCDEDPKGRIFLPLNEKKRKTFMRITREDTITEWSIDKIYYISNSNKNDSDKIEYFTAAGEYPLDLKRKVRKLTRYIFDKDSMNRKLPADDSLAGK